MSTLTGTVDNNPELRVVNDGAAGPGIRGFSTNDRGVFGRHMGTTGIAPGVEGLTSSTDPNAVALQGTLSSNADPTAVAVRGSGGPGTGVLGSSATGVGVVAKGNPDALHADGDPTDGTGGVFTGGFYGVIAKGDFGVYSEAPHIALYGKTMSSDPNSDAVYGYSSSGTAIVGQVASAGGKAGRFDGAVQVNGPLEGNGKLTVNGPVAVNGQLAVNGSLSGCPQGSIDGFALVPGSSTFSSNYTTLPTAFDCSGGTVRARRAGTGVYFVRFNGLGSVLATGTVQHSYVGSVLTVNKATDPLDNQPAFRVGVRDSASSGGRDQPFLLLTF